MSGPLTFDKSVTSWRGQKSVMSVVSCRFRNSITTTCRHIISHHANKSAASVYGETSVMEFVHNRVAVP